MVDISTMKTNFTFFILLILILSCFSKNTTETVTETEKQFENSSKVIHILVALCDNKYRGIFPVPTKIGNGQNL
jgi:hypothetical protein